MLRHPNQRSDVRRTVAISFFFLGDHVVAPRAPDPDDQRDRPTRLLGERETAT
jgi:hypothetical protein